MHLDSSKGGMSSKKNHYGHSPPEWNVSERWYLQGTGKFKIEFILAFSIVYSNLGILNSQTSKQTIASQEVKDNRNLAISSWPGETVGEARREVELARSTGSNRDFMQRRKSIFSCLVDYEMSTALAITHCLVLSSIYIRITKFRCFYGV